MEFTARNAAKHAVKAAISMQVTQLAKNALADYVGLDDDSKTVKIGAYMIAWAVSDKLQPYTDKAVDKTADFIAAKRAARSAKKNTTEEQK